MTIIYLKIAANADGTTAYVRLLGEGKDVQQSPLWVKSRHDLHVRMMTVLPPKQTFRPRKPMSALCHKRL
jgi:hypothetical protein